ncbi:helix-turn-helix protein [Stackebrandtia albiflava]|uniref:Helix-turn-helix protein n=1 Tax=Stackebrandtia albiflava TaxID=406432 RepID=A0A562VE06_9ACTN|nr:helix-turn-helix domain-containing protein [Stackebrandtia albiflava]TWJ16119.1 helix-turn-helix protein [Stackebrandtia albiflava]
MSRGMVNRVYEEKPPPPELSGVVRCVWRTDATGGRAILPDGCLDLILTPDTVFVAGADTVAYRPSGPRRPGPVHGVRFHPGAAPAVLGTPADRITDLRPDLEALWGVPGRDVTERLLAGETGPLDVVRARLRPGLDVDVRRLAAALESGAPVPDSDLGPRQLRRRFTAAVGYGPARFRRVARLQRFLRLAEPGRYGLAELAFRAGYADQAHLTRECRVLTGQTPRVLLADRFVQSGVPGGRLTCPDDRRPTRGGRPARTRIHHRQRPHPRTATRTGVVRRR